MEEPASAPQGLTDQASAVGDALPSLAAGLVVVQRASEQGWPSPPWGVAEAVARPTGGRGRSVAVETQPWRVVEPCSEAEPWQQRLERPPPWSHLSATPAFPAAPHPQARQQPGLEKLGQQGEREVQRAAAQEVGPPSDQMSLHTSLGSCLASSDSPVAAGGLPRPTFHLLRQVRRPSLCWCARHCLLQSLSIAFRSPHPGRQCRPLVLRRETYSDP